MSSLLSRTVEINVTNRTRDVTLHSPRSYCYSGYSSVPPSPSISPGATESCTFINTPIACRGSVGILVYEGDTFTIAILFSNPYNYNFFYMEFALEISPQKAHLGTLEDIYGRMYRGVPAHPHISGTFQIVKLHASQETIVVSAGSMQVMATMSNAAKSIIKLVVEDKGCPPPYSEAVPSFFFKPSILQKGRRKADRSQKRQVSPGPNVGPQCL